MERCDTPPARGRIPGHCRCQPAARCEERRGDCLRTVVHDCAYVAAFAPDVDETAAGLSGKFHAQFAADLPMSDATIMAATQRPITDVALNEPSAIPAWKSIPSWFIFGDQDKNIPPSALTFMAERASSRETVVVKGASHVVMVSNPERVADLIRIASGS